MSLRSRCSDDVRPGSASEDAPTDDEAKQRGDRTSSLGQDSGYCAASFSSSVGTKYRDAFHRNTVPEIGPSTVEEFFKKSRDLHDSTNWVFESGDTETSCLTSTGQVDSSDDLFPGGESNETTSRAFSDCGSCTGRNKGNCVNNVQNETEGTRSSWSVAKKVSFFQTNDKKFRDPWISNATSHDEIGNTAGQNLTTLKEKEAPKFWHRWKNTIH